MDPLPLVQCPACGGIYAPTQANSQDYFHVCPARKVVASKPAPTQTDPNATTPVYAATVNPRDENVVVDPKSGTVAQKAPGADPIPVTDPAQIAAYYQTQ